MSFANDAGARQIRRGAGAPRARSAFARADGAVMNLPSAHIGGIPVEETLASFGPAVLIVLGAAAATLRGRLRRMRSRSKHL
jgi:hypothetical protein